MPTLAYWVQLRSPCTSPAQSFANCFTKHKKGLPGAQARTERHGSSGVGLGRKQHIKIGHCGQAAEASQLVFSLRRQHLVQHRPHIQATDSGTAGRMRAVTVLSAPVLWALHTLQCPVVWAVL